MLFGARTRSRPAGVSTVTIWRAPIYSTPKTSPRKAAVVLDPDVLRPDAEDEVAPGDVDVQRRRSGDRCRRARPRGARAEAAVRSEKIHRRAADEVGDERVRGRS